MHHLERHSFARQARHLSVAGVVVAWAIFVGCDEAAAPLSAQPSPVCDIVAAAHQLATPQALDCGAAIAGAVESTAETAQALYIRYQMVKTCVPLAAKGTLPFVAVYKVNRKVPGEAVLRRPGSPNIVTLREWGKAEYPCGKAHCENMVTAVTCAEGAFDPTEMACTAKIGSLEVVCPEVR